MPVIDGGLAVALARAATVAGLLSLFGGLAFQTIVAPKTLATLDCNAQASLGKTLNRMLRVSLCATLLAALLWLTAQTADLADTTSLASTLRAIPLVLSGTVYGHLMALQFLLLIAIAIAFALRRPRVEFALSATVLAIQAGHSHAAAMEESGLVLLLSDVVHLLSAGGWLGGLLPLLLTVATTPPSTGAVAARWFSPFGQFCVVGLLASAALQALTIFPTLTDLVSTDYGRIILIKAMLLVALLGLAILNRFQLAPALRRPTSPTARRALVISILLQTACGLALIMAAAILSALPPPMVM